MEVVFLGTSSMVPTKDRNHSALFITYKNEGILLDCGEGTQRQLRIAGIPLTKISKILISHWHGDHTLGLAGLLQTLNSHSHNYQGVLELYGPPGISKFLDRVKSTFEFDVAFQMRVIEIKPGVIFDCREFFIESALLDHSTPSYGFSVTEHDRRHMNKAAAKKLGIPEGPLLGKLQDGHTIELKGRKIKPDDVSTVTKGKKLAVIPDTQMCKSCIDLAKDANLLISESTYANDLAHKAEEYKHLTAGQAGFIANKANAKRLILTHFSQRYKDTSQIEQDVKTVFDNSSCARDFMKVKV
jgi:ribonuclease Z